MSEDDDCEVCSYRLNARMTKNPIADAVNVQVVVREDHVDFYNNVVESVCKSLIEDQVRAAMFPNMDDTIKEIVFQIKTKLLVVKTQTEK